MEYSWDGGAYKRGRCQRDSNCIEKQIADCHSRYGRYGAACCNAETTRHLINKYTYILWLLWKRGCARTGLHFGVDERELLHKLVDAFLVGDGLTVNKVMVDSSAAVRPFQNLHNV